MPRKHKRTSPYENKELLYTKEITLCGLKVKCTANNSPDRGMHVHLQVTGLPEDRTQNQGVVLMQAIADQMTVHKYDYRVYGGREFECDRARGLRYFGPTGVFFHTDRYIDAASLEPLNTALTKLETNHGHRSLDDFCPAYNAQAGQKVIQIRYEGPAFQRDGINAAK